MFPLAWFFEVSLFTERSGKITLRSHGTGRIGSLGNDDVDVNEDGKKAISWDWQNNNFARTSRFFVHFFAVSALLRRETAQFHVFFLGREHETTFYFFCSWTLMQSFRIQLQEKLPIFDEMNEIE